MNKITMDLQVDHLILEALREDISSEDVTTNAVMKEAVTGEVELICKQDGVIAGLDVFERVFRLLDANTKVELYCKDGDQVKNGELMKSGWRYPCTFIRRASGVELSAENERNRNIHTLRCRAFKGKRYKAFRYEKDDAEYAYF